MNRGEKKKKKILLISKTSRGEESSNKTYKRDPLHRPPSQMKNRELPHSGYSIPSNPVQFSQYTGPVLGRKLHGFKFPTAISPHTNIKLTGTLVPPDDRGSSFKITTDIVRISHGQRARIQSDNGVIGNT